MSFRKVPDGSGRKAWVLGLTHNNHNHDMEPNPLIYNKHLERHPDFIRVQAEIREQREAVVPYNAYNGGIHDSDQEQGKALALGRKTFYNNARTKRGQKILEASASGDNILKQMLRYLEGARFIIRSRWSEPSHGDWGHGASSMPPKSLEQIFFCTLAMVNMARRFISGFIMQPDAGFTMRLHNMPLHCCVGMTNTNTTFPCSFSLTRTGDKTSLDFVFQCVNTSGSLGS